MRVALYLLLALFILCVESVTVKVFGLSVTRLDVTIAIVVFLGLRATTVEGAFTAFGIGYLLDVFSGRPTGLYPFLAVLVFLLVRLLSSFVDARARVLYAAMSGAAVLGHALLAVFFSMITSVTGGGSAVFTLSGVPMQIALTAIAAYLLWPLLTKIDPGQERPRTGVLL